MNVEIDFDLQAIANIEQAVKAAAVEAMESVHGEVINDVPLDQGTLQNSVYVDKAEMDDGFHVWIDHGQIYARYLYMGKAMVDRETGKGPALIHDKHGSPIGFRFRKGAKLKVKQPEQKLKFKNDRKDHWLEPYFTGDKKNVIKERFVHALKNRLGR